MPKATWESPGADCLTIARQSMWYLVAGLILLYMLNNTFVEANFGYTDHEKTIEDANDFIIKHCGVRVTRQGSKYEGNVGETIDEECRRAKHNLALWPSYVAVTRGFSIFFGQMNLCHPVHFSYVHGLPSGSSTWEKICDANWWSFTAMCSSLSVMVFFLWGNFATIPGLIWTAWISLKVMMNGRHQKGD